jgi:hypothetical protein
MSSDWRFLFFELNGDGTENFIRGDVLLDTPSAIKVLSGPHQIGGVLTIPVQDLQLADGSPVLRRWKTTVYLQDPNGEIWAGGVLVDFTIDGPALTVDVSGLTTYAKDQPYGAEYSQLGVDPLDVVRDIWGYLQNQTGGNIGLVLDDTTSPVRIGVPADSSTASPSDGEDLTGTQGAIKMNWWSTDDCGGAVDTLAKNTPFDYLERHYWDGEIIRHRLELGYPGIGARKTDPRFVLGENVYKIPSETYAADDVVTEVWVLGAGEGRARLRGVASLVPKNSVRRVKIIDDKTLDTQEKVDAQAQQELATYQPDMPGAGITELVVSNHSNAPLGSYDVGDEILYSGDHEWGDIAIWVKITRMALSPNGGDDVTISVVRTDTLVA